MKKRTMRGRVFLLVFLFLVIGNTVIAQQARESFGKNRMQYKTFTWKFFSSENFDVYFYEGGENAAEEAVGYLEEQFERITEIIGHSPYFKTKVFLYNSISDLQQSNVGVSDRVFTVGGQTNFSKSYVEVANTGTITSLKRELVMKTTQLIVNEMMYGGSFSDSWQNSFLLNLPEWFIDGVAYYLARGWGIEMDDYMRDRMNYGKIKKLSKFTGEDAAIVGQSIWNFIVEKYGRSNIQNILQLTRITRNVEKSITHTLGVNFKQITLEWQLFYADMAAFSNNSYIRPPKEDIIKTRVRHENKFNDIKISPDGKKIAFSKNFKGRYTVYVKYLESGDEIAAISGGYKVINQEVDYGIPLLGWADDNTIGIINVVKGIYTFWLYDINSRSKIPTPLEEFDQVKSFGFNGNGRLAVLSGERKGKNDLYLMSVRRGRLRQLTNDHFDDIDPGFIQGTNTIIFSSNRASDTLSVDESDISKISQTNFNIFYYNLDTTTNVLARITNTISKDVMPIALNEYEVYYLSNQKGIVNVFSYSLTDSTYRQVTNYITGLKAYDINFTHGQLAGIILDGYEDRILFSRRFNYEQNNFTPLTKRQQVIQAKFLNKRRIARRQETKRTEVPIQLNFQRPEKEETTEPKPPAGDKGISQTDIIDTDNYVFDKEVVEKTEDRGSFLTQYRLQQSSTRVLGPLPYETRFSANNLITSMVIDPLRGFGILLETQLNDQLENHKFYGGIMATTDLRSGDIYMEYQYLKTLVDYNARYERNVIYLNTESALQRYSANTFELGASLPLTVKTRSTFKPFYTFTRYENLDPTLLNIPGPPFPDKNTVSYLGFKSELIYDNTVLSGMNLIEGSRGKIEFIHHEAVSDRSKSFSSVSVDLRRYQKIHKSLIIAGRIYYGKFFGQDPQSFLLGGMDNWFFNQSNTQGKDNPLNISGNEDNSDLLFVEYVTSLRGFDYATFYGSNALLFNLELRWPVVRYFYHGPISSNFFKNLLLTGFFDAGSSWTGISPFKRDNSVNTEIIKNEGSAFQAEIRNFSNPWLSSYGFGLRTVVLGYYMKFDLAWPIENYEIGNPKVYVTLGYDF